MYFVLYKCDWVTQYGVENIKFQTKKHPQTVLRLLDSLFFEHVFNKNTSKKKIRDIFSFSSTKAILIWSILFR